MSSLQGPFIITGRGGSCQAFRDHSFFLEVLVAHYVSCKAYSTDLCALQPFFLCVQTKFDMNILAFESSLFIRKMKPCCLQAIPNSQYLE